LLVLVLLLLLLSWLWVAAHMLPMRLLKQLQPLLLARLSISQLQPLLLARLSEPHWLLQALLPACLLPPTTSP
jgi:hypothetical protein